TFLPILPGKKRARLVAVDDTGAEVASVRLVGIGVRNSSIEESPPSSAVPSPGSPGSPGMRGTGEPPIAIPLPVTRRTGKLSVSPKDISFGEQAVGTESPAQTMTISNVGDGPLT